VHLLLKRSYITNLIGTYTDKTHRKAEAECSSCPPGKFCRGEGNQIWTDECEAGYICLGGSNTSTPIDGVTGKICPKGYVAILYSCKLETSDQKEKAIQKL